SNNPAIGPAATRDSRGSGEVLSSASVRTCVGERWSGSGKGNVAGNRRGSKAGNIAPLTRLALHSPCLMQLEFHQLDRRWEHLRVHHPGRQRRLSNLGYDEWPNFLGNRPMVEALLSRLRHYCQTVHIKGPSRKCWNSASAPTIADALTLGGSPRRRGRRL